MYCRKYMISFRYSISYMHSPSWSTLYELARAFRKLAPWGWTYDSDLFGIENPANGEIGYCCVMGNAGKYFGLAIYRGSRGLYNYERLQALDVDRPILLARSPLEQDCMMLEFGSRASLTEPEAERIKSLGLRFRGDLGWPRFLDYQPGYVPVPIVDEEQVAHMISFLEQSILLTKRLRRQGDMLDHSSSKGQRLLIRRLKPSASTPAWEDSWVEMPVPEPPLPFQVNPLFLRSNLGNLRRQDQTWIADVFYLPQPVVEGDRPYFGLMCLFIDAESRQIIGYDLFPPWRVGEGLQQSLVETARRQGFLANRVAVHVEENLSWFRNLFHALEVELYLDQQLEFVDDIKISLFGEMTAAE